MPQRVPAIAGERYGFYTVLGEGPSAPDGKVRWYVVCGCGAQRLVGSFSLRKGLTKSCGCQKGAFLSAAKTTHGMARSKHRNQKQTKEYQMYHRMMRRCYDEGCTQYRWYGARGITVHESMQSLSGFLAVIRGLGPQPDGTTLDRIDNDGNYEPGNLRWASPKTQASNRRNSLYAERQGKVQMLTDWAQELGISYNALYYHYRKHGSLDSVAAV